MRDPVTDHLLTPRNSAPVVIDYQPSQVQTVTSVDQQLLIDNILSVARLAKTFNMPSKAVSCGDSALPPGAIVLGEGGEIVTQNFDRYPVVRIQSTPIIEVHLIDSDEPPTGVGEVSVPTTAPAVANAIAALIGTRVRRLPINKSIRIY